MFQRVFKEINVDSVGRAMAYLTLVYRTNHLTDEATVRQAVRLVVPVLRKAFVGCTSNIELMGVNVNNLYKTQLVFCYF